MDELQVGGRGGITESFKFATTDSVPVLSLRYWSLQSNFVLQAEQLLGARLPTPVRAREIPPLAASASSVLVWRSPTETLLIARNGEGGAMSEPAWGALANINSMPSSDGCALDMTGAFSLVTCSGLQIAAVFARLGDPGILPSINEAKLGRLAELPALAFCVRERECHILIERYYARHLEEWIQQAAACLI